MSFFEPKILTEKSEISGNDSFFSTLNPYPKNSSDLNLFTLKQFCNIKEFKPSFLGGNNNKILTSTILLENFNRFPKTRKKVVGE